MFKSFKLAFSRFTQAKLHYRQCLRPAVTFMVSPRRFKARGRRDGVLRAVEPGGAGMDLQNKLQKPRCTHSLPWQQETLLTLKTNKSSLFSCKTGACQCICTEEALVKNFHNYLFFSLTAFMRTQKGLSHLPSLKRHAECY